MGVHFWLCIISRRQFFFLSTLVTFTSYLRSHPVLKKRQTSDCNQILWLIKWVLCLIIHLKNKQCTPYSFERGNNNKISFIFHYLETCRKLRLINKCTFWNVSACTVHSESAQTSSGEFYQFPLFGNNRGHGVLGTVSTAELLWPSSDLCWHTSVSVPFQNMSNLLNLPQVGPIRVQRHHKDDQENL